MKTGFRMGLAGIGVVILATLALAVTTYAQTPGPENQPGGGMRREGRGTRAMRRAGAPAQNTRHRADRRQQFAFATHPDIAVSVTESDSGVTIHLTTENAELAEKLQENLPQRIERLREQAAKWEERREEIEERRKARGLEAPMGPNLLASDKVHTEVVATDKGVDIVMTSGDRELVEQIQETVPKHIERAQQFRKRAQAMKKHMKEHPGAMMRGAQMLNLMLSPKVDTQLTETDKGVTIQLSSDDAELAKKLQTVFGERLQNLRELREKTGEAGEAPMPMRRQQMERPGRQQGAGGRAPGGEAAPMRRMGTGEGAPTRRMGTGAGRPDDERMREIIREEIRRYFEEEGVDL